MTHGAAVKTPHHFFEHVRKLRRSQSSQSQTGFPGIDGGQLKAAVFDGQT
jgi:hypothetical protein